ncbi:hypothetical protein Q9966_002717 [Columba livia]|nr:hypothetical protein Q9966_002717 [Columba livia]
MERTGAAFLSFSKEDKPLSIACSSADSCKLFSARGKLQLDGTREDLAPKLSYQNQIILNNMVKNKFRTLMAKRETHIMDKEYKSEESQKAQSGSAGDLQRLFTPNKPSLACKPALALALSNASALITEVNYLAVDNKLPKMTLRANGPALFLLRVFSLDPETPCHGMGFGLGLQPWDDTQKPFPLLPVSQQDEFSRNVTRTNTTQYLVYGV